MQTEGSNNFAGLGSGKMARAGIGGIVLFCLIVYLPGFFALPTVDRDEARFAQASRQMYESVALPIGQRDAKKHGGRLVIPMVQDRPRLNKPPLIYWMQAASAAVLSRGNPFRDEIWMYRVPSLIAAIVVVVLTKRLGALMFDSGAGGLAAVFVAVCPVMAWEARQARADMVLVAWTTWAMLQLWKAYAWGRVGSAGTAVTVERPGYRGAVCFWIAVAGGVMTKGPITPMVAGMTAIALCLAGRRWRWLLDLKPLLALPILVLAVGPWVYAVARHVGFENYWNTIYRETIGRSTEAAEGHWGPPGYHLVLAAGVLWPGWLLLGPGLVVAWKLARAKGAGGSWRDGHPSYLFLLAWLLPWFVFEAISTKLPHYTMPMYPALAVLGARAVLAADAGALPGAGARAAWWLRVLWMLVGAGLAALAIGGLITRVVIWPASVVGNVGLAIVLLIAGPVLYKLLRASWTGMNTGKFARAAVSGVLAMVVFWMVVPTFVLPRVMGLTHVLGVQLSKVDPGAGRPIAAVGYQEDSLVYFTRGRLERLDVEAAPAWLAMHPDGLLIRDRKKEVKGGPAMQEVGSAMGLNYSRGRVQRVAIEEVAR